MTFGKVIRILLAAAAMLLVAWSFFDVGVRTLRSVTGSDRSAETLLTVLHWGTPEEEAIVQAMIDAFKTENPDIDVLRIHAGDYDAKLKTMLAAGTPPDLFYLKPEDVPEFAETGMAMKLDAFIAAERAAGTGAWVDDFYPVLMNAFRWDSGRQITGATGASYGLPKDFTTAVMYVNLDLFERAGVEVPYDGWTWDEYRAAMKKIAALSPEDKPGERIWGGVIKHWPDALRSLVWTFGGSFFGGESNGDFRDVQLDSPESLACLELIRELRFEDQSVFNASGLAESDDDLFRRGRIGCLGPYGRWFTPRARQITDFKWDVVPVPHAADAEPASIYFTVSWAVSAQTKHPEAARKLLKSLCAREGQVRTAELGLAMPSMKSVAESDVFLEPGRDPQHTRIFLDAVGYGRLAQYPRLKEFNHILDRELKDVLILDKDKITVADAAANVEKLWLNELASPLHSKQYDKMPWGKVLGVTGVFVALGVGLLVYISRREKLGSLSRAEERTGWLFISPWIIGFLAFVIGPIITALLLALSKWSAMAPLGEARYVGLDNFTHMFGYDANYAQSLWVTVYFTILIVPIGQVGALLVALLMNVEVKGIGLFRTTYFVPSVVTGVALVTLWIVMYNNEQGVINAMISATGLPAPDWFGKDGPIFAIPAIVIMSLWGVGGGMVIYLAGLKNIPASLYEAARIDGAGPVRQFFSVTLPMLSPLIFFQLVMAIIGSFQVFTQAYVITSSTGGENPNLLVYVLNLYRHAFQFHNMGYASALAWVLFLVLIVLTSLIFKSSKSWVHYEGLKG